ncbi:MAG: phage shock protein PspA [Desulfovibrio sp.]|nr:MAG: phage shock protein PspA [Desulfovibrio sp.]
MGIFSRFTDIISSNINSMLDKAENPEKMIRLMIREMEETLIELKSSCAGAMADRKQVGREMADVEERVDVWNNRAQLAVDKGREDLAREALQEKLRWLRRQETLEQEQVKFDALVEQCQDDIERLEEKLADAREKQRILVQRHIRAATKMRAQEEIRRASGTDALLRFEEFERRIERMEAEAKLVNTPARPSLEEEFAQLEGDDDISEELESLKGKGKPKTDKAADKSKPETGK